MTSRREQILNHMATVLAETAGITGIYRSRVEAFSRNEAPLLLIESTGDRGTVMNSCRMAWTLDVAVVVHTRGAVPETLADPILVSAHQLLMADRTMGGLIVDIVPTTSNPQRDNADLASLWLVNTYQISYRTLQSDLEMP